MNELYWLPNIGKILEEKLKVAGITIAEQLREAGAENAFQKLSTDDSAACLNLLCALEGAFQGIRWHHLQKKRKDELKAFLQMKKII